MKYCPICNEKTIRYKNRGCSKCSIQRLKERRLQNKEKNKDRNPFDETLKKCPNCKRLLPRKKNLFYTSPSELDGLGSKCKICFSIKNKPGIKMGNLTIEILEALKEAGCYFDSPDCIGELHLDHNHKTGRIRGYVCEFHNINFLPGFEYAARLYKKDKIEFERWIQYIFNPPTAIYY